MKFVNHIQVLVAPVILSFCLIYFSGASNGPSNSFAAKCFSISPHEERELGISGAGDVILIRPHGCQSCTRDDVSVLKVISKSNRTVVCLLDSDATDSDVKHWESLGPVKAFRRNKLDIELRKITLGLYLVHPGEGEACRIEPNEI